MELSDFKIYDLVDDAFTGLSYYNLDLTKHLQENLVLKKLVTREANGRPTHAMYSSGGVDMAKRTFTFVDNPESSLVIMRTEHMSFIKLDGSYGPSFLIKSWTVDVSNSDHLVFMASEREMGRKFIINELKILVYGAMQAVYPNEDLVQLGTRAGEFFGLHASVIEQFIQTGDKSISASMAQDMDPDHTTFLDASSGIPNVSVRQAIIAKVNY